MIGSLMNLTGDAYEGHESELLEGEKPLIQIHHDESTFYTNADQSHYWADNLNFLFFNFLFYCGYSKPVTNTKHEGKEDVCVWLHFIFFYPHAELEQLQKGFRGWNCR